MKIETTSPVSSIHIYFHNLLHHHNRHHHKSHHINSHHANNHRIIDKPSKNTNANDKLSKDNNSFVNTKSLDENEHNIVDIDQDNERNYANGTHFIEIYHWIVNYD